MRAAWFIFLILIFTPLAFGGDTTFKTHGKLRADITAVPVNQADSSAAYMIITGIIPGDGAIVGDLYDPDDNLVAKKRVYRYTGARKNSPFANLNEGQEGYLSGKPPGDKWAEKEIKLWLKDRQKKDGKDDPYYFKSDTQKNELIELSRAGTGGPE